MTQIQEYIARKKYSQKLSLQEKSYSEPSTNESSRVESNLIDILYKSSYNDMKESLKKDFEIKVKSVQEQYESQVIDVILKAIDSIDSEISDMNLRLSNTIDLISKNK